MPCNHHPDSIPHIDGLFSYALVLTDNHAEAENLVQETYLRAKQAIGSLREDSNQRPGSLLSYVTSGGTN
jgi:DNA-directed RNA polymerase specialized sigma24 family protein